MPTTRESRHAEIKRVIKEWPGDSDPTHEEIGRELGISTSYVTQVINDPTGEKERQRKNQYREPCKLCGKPKGPQSQSELCQSCSWIERRKAKDIPEAKAA